MTHTKPGLKASTDALVAVLYARVSSDRNKQEKSVGQQDKLGRALVDDQGWTLAKVFKDNNRSASHKARRVREAWVELLEYLENNHVDILILWESSRGGRKASAWLSFLELCQEKGIHIHVIRDHRTYDLSIARDWKSLAEDGVDNQYEVMRLADRVGRSMNESKELGKPVGVCPFGYEREFHPRTKVFVGQFVVDGLAQDVVQAYTDFDNGMSCLAIARWFNDKGHRTSTGKLWTGPAIRELLKKPAYIGMREYISQVDRLAGVKHGELITAAWAPITTDPKFPALWRRVNDAIAHPQRPGKAAGRITCQNIGSGIAVCGVCGQVQRVRVKNGKRVHQCRKGCTLIDVAAFEALLDELVPERILTMRLPEDDAAERAEALETIGLIEIELSALLARTKLPFNDAARVSRLAYEDERAHLEPQLAELRKIAHGRSEAAGVVGWLTTHKERWFGATLQEKRHLLRSGFLVDSIVIEPAPCRGAPASERVVIEWTEDRLVRESLGTVVELPRDACRTSVLTMAA